MITEIAYKDHEEWLSLRRKYIGGSEAGAVVGLDSYKSPFSLWAEKTGKMPEFKGNITTKVGAYLEDLVAHMFSEESGKRVRRKNRTLVNDTYPWACANVDRMIAGESALLEIKTTNSLPAMKKIKSGEYPERWYCQMVHYLAVTGLQKAYLAVLVNCRELRIFELERDEAEIAALMAAEGDFWNNHVLTDIPPAADGNKATTEAVNEVYALTDNDTVSLVQLENELDRYIAIGNQIKELKKLQDEAANSVKIKMGESCSGESNRYTVKWAFSERLSFDSKSFIEEHRDTDLDKYIKTTKVRTFRVTERKEA